MRGGAFLNGKEGRVGFRKAFFNGKEGRDDFRKKTLSVFIHILIILLILPRSNMIHPFLRYRDTILRSPRYPPQTGVMAPNRVPSEACENRWRNAYRDPFCQLHK